MPRVAVLHHLDHLDLGHARQILEDAGLELDERDLKGGDPLPELREADAILAMGGDQSIRDVDDYPYLQAEAELMRAAIERDVPVLGVCLGGQLLARALGGSVHQQPRIIEWVEVRRLPEADGDPVFGSLPPAIRALHWNEDWFSTPDGAVELLSRAGPGGEAFRFGQSAWGIQFHPEADEALLEGWYEDLEQLVDAGVDAGRARQADRVHLPGQRAVAGEIFGGFASYVARRGQP
jgi:GMP synthase (glutamine-hydrolysing)